MSPVNFLKEMYKLPTQEFLDNPYKTYDKIRNLSPLAEMDKNFWLATDFHHVKSILMNSSFGRGDMYRVPPIEEELSPVEIMRKNWMLYNDPPNHTKLKKFSLKVLESYLDKELAVKVEDISKFLIDSIDSTKTFDLIEEYAYPLPLLVIADLLGVPKQDRSLFKRWSAEVNKTLEPCCSVEQKRYSDSIVLEVYKYFNELIFSKAIPENSILNKLINNTIDGIHLTREEVIYTAILLLIAGHETTSSMTGLGILTLTKFPEVYQDLQKNPNKIPKAVEELLRYEAPVQLARRVALEDTTIFNKEFKKGDIITVCFGAVNYDPAIFENPYEFRLDRNKMHMSFGLGTHFCLGTKLARLEGQIVFKDLITKLPLLKRTDKNIFWKNNLVLRGLESLNLVRN